MNITEKQLGELETNAKHWADAGAVIGEGLITLPAIVLLKTVDLARQGLRLQPYTKRLNEVIRQRDNEITTLQQSLDAAKRDTERLEWVIKNPITFSQLWMFSTHIENNHGEMRHKIDHAINAEKESK